MSQSVYVAMDKPGATGGSGAAKDPFYVVKEKVQVQIRNLRIDFDRWKDLFETVDTTSNAEFKSKNNSVRVIIKDLKARVNDLKKTIQIVEQNRPSFPDIDDDELNKRKKFVSEAKNVMEEVVNVITSQRTKDKMNADKTGSTAPPPPMSLEEKQRNEQERDYVETRANAQSQVQEEQDVVLTDMHEALKRLGDIAVTMDTELDTQNNMLDDWKGEMDDTQGDVDSVNAKLEKLLKSSDKGKLCCILMLFVIVVVLFFVLIYGWFSGRTAKVGSSDCKIVHVPIVPNHMQ